MAPRVSRCVGGRRQAAGARRAGFRRRRRRGRRAARVRPPTSTIVGADRRVERDLGRRRPRPHPGRTAREPRPLLGGRRRRSPRASGRTRRSQARPAMPEDDADRAAEQALDQRLARHLANDEPLRPAERLQRAELADPLRHRRERQQARDQEGGEQPDDHERGAERAGEVLRVDERSRDAIGEIRRGRHRRAVERLLDRSSRRRSTSSALSARTYTVFTRPLRSESACSCDELHVDVRGLAAERRLRDPDHREGLPAERQLVTDAEVLAARRSSR